MSDPHRPLRVAIDARVPAGQWGGVQQMVEGLARGLRLLEGDDEFLFIGYDDAATWLDPLLGGPCRRVPVPRSHGRSRRRRAYDAIAHRAPPAARLLAALGHRIGGLATPIQTSDGTLESLGVDAVHFVTPQAYLTDVPSVYQVMDLLHEHLPEFFSPLHRRYRREAYQAFGDRAAIISTMADWTRTDIMARMAQPSSKVAVVQLPPAVTPETVIPAPPPAFDTATAPFILYPAQTWAHKNHLALVEAMARLRDGGSDLRLVCTGRRTDHYPAIRHRIDELRLGDRIRFLGYVEQAQLAWLYRHASAMVFPTLFEGWGIPVVEAFAWDLPVACSGIAVLDEAAGGAAVRFDPANPEAIAAAIGRVVGTPDLRAELVAKGRVRLDDLTWDRTARTFVALYRRAAGHEPIEADAALLAPPTLLA
jgi:glycosyltransferase involved in cell wall biosynthesis